MADSLLQSDALMQAYEHTGRHASSDYALLPKVISDQRATGVIFRMAARGVHVDYEAD